MISAAELKKLREDIVFSETLKGQPLTFHATWGTFSPREIDAGTVMLLDYMEIREGDDCLDLGCGYGPIGMTMAKIASTGETLLVDRDFIAVEYANANLARNGITNAEARLSNGFNQIEAGRKFDLIASNIPAKVGNEMLYLFLYDALAHLKPGGRIYVVTITGLRQFFKRACNEVFGNYKKLKQGPQYTVAMAEKNAD
ncbi:MAG: methyltransferase [Chromatiales bacterium]|nr:methyltransferase [Chromatiales bacterium]